MANAPIEPRARIMLQVVPAFPIPDGILTTIVAETAAIWAQYGVEVAATRELTRMASWSGIWITLVIRDTPAPAGHVSQAPGDTWELASLPFVDGVPTCRMFAWWDTAHRLVAAAGLDRLPPDGQKALAARVLGRAIAHELGHYLLGTRSHTAHGLMRAAFGPRDAWPSGREAFRLDAPQMTALEARGR